MNAPSPHRVVIGPENGDRLYWRDLWSYRGLFAFLAWRDILVRYKQTTIGIAWSVLRPLLTLLVMAFLGWLFRSNVPEGVPRLLLVAAATLPWTFFSTAFSEAANSLVSNSNLLTKVYFPRLIVPASSIIVCLIDLAISLALFALLMVIFRFLPDGRVFLLPFFLLLAVLASFGAGLLVSALNVKFRDFRFLVPFIVQLGMYVSPIAFSTSDILGNARIPAILKGLYMANPMVGVIDGFRWCLLRGAVPLHTEWLAVSVALSVLLLLFGVRYFRRVERSFADVI